MDEGATCPLTRCPEFKCPEIVTENFFKALVPPDKFATYQRCVKGPGMGPAGCGSWMDG